jgi:outer membrane lipoprotein-sorting protein
LASALLAFALLALVLAGAARAAPDGELSLNDLLNSFSDRYRGLANFKASYVRSTATPASDAIFRNKASHVAAGTLYWQKPLRLKLDQNEPDPETMLTDGSAAWWYIPREKTVHVYPELDLEGEFMPLLAFFDGIDSLRQKFSIALEGDDPAREGEYGLILTPKEEPARRGIVTVYLDQNSVITGFKIGSPTGEETNFALAGLELNLRLDDSFFKFRAPKGTKVVTEAYATD